MGTSFRTLKVLTFSLLFAILAVYALVMARNFLYPIVMAMLFAYLLYPAVSKLESWGVPRILSNLVAILVAMALLVTLLVLLYKQLSVFVTDLPSLQEKALSNLNNLQRNLEQKFGLGYPRDTHWLRARIVSAFKLSSDFIQEVLMATTGTVTKIAIMPVYTFFLLYYRNKFEHFIYRVIPEQNHPKARNIIEQVSQVTKHYMAGVVIVILILCVINSTGLLIIGVDYAILLGILSAIMNFIPYFGTLIGGAIPIFYTITVQGEPNKALAVVILFILIQFTENNILTPNITGSRVNINPLFTILSIVLGGMIWGLPGMFVSIPLLGMFKIICDNFRGLSAFSYLLGTRGTEKHAFSLSKLIRRFKHHKPKT